MSTVEDLRERVTSAFEQARRREQAEQVAYWRYQLIRDAADPGLSPRARGRLIRSLAATVHKGPFGDEVQVSRQTLDRWVRTWRRGGFTSLLPPLRQVTPRTPVEVLDLAVALKREQPDRTAAQVARILRAHSGWSPSERTLLRHFDRLELRTRPDGQPPQTFGRFEADAPNIRWVGDALHGPKVAGRKTYLFCFLDDHSRAVMGARWGSFEDVVRLTAALRNGLAARGVPRAIHVDNGSAFVDGALKRAAARLGIRIIHSTPYRPEGKGKIERFFATVRGQFLVEVGDGGRIADLEELNRLFVAWVETVYHRRVHEGTGQTPLDRWLAGAPFPQPTPDQLAEAFLWSVNRQVRKTAEISLFGNVYEVDPFLAGRVVELVFDPFDLTRVEVRHNGKPMGLAAPRVIGRHVHRKARSEQPTPPPPATGIDYLHLVEAEHTRADARRINFDALTSQEPGPADSDHGAASAQTTGEVTDEQPEQREAS
jgi:putative transposase